MRFQPLGGVIEAVPPNRAETDATSRSPLTTVDGRRTDTVDPKVVSVITPYADGTPPLSAGPDLAIVMPSTSASARNGM
jgi:hypothetical protein